MIDALKAADRKALMALVVDHIQPSKRMYLEVRRGLETAVPIGANGRSQAR